jgi:plastocyanin
MFRRVVGLTAVGVLFAVTGLAAKEGADDGRPEIEVTAMDYEFQTASEEVPAGWTTVELTNEGEETHVLELFRIPEEGTYREVRRYYGVLDTLGSDLAAGTIDSATYRETLKEHTPSFQLERVGGPGMVAPGRTTHATSRLEPGTHVMICYVRDSTGTPHIMRGMRSRLEVAPSSSEAKAPEADLEVTLAEYRMTVEGDLERGEQTVAVHYGEREKAL